MAKKKRRWYNAKQRNALHNLVLAMFPSEEPIQSEPTQNAEAILEDADRLWAETDWAALEKELEQIDDDRELARIALDHDNITEKEL